MDSDVCLLSLTLSNIDRVGGEIEFLCFVSFPFDFKTFVPNEMRRRVSVDFYIFLNESQAVCVVHFVSSVCCMSVDVLFAINFCRL